MEPLGPGIKGPDLELGLGTDRAYAEVKRRPKSTVVVDAAEYHANEFEILEEPLGPDAPVIALIDLIRDAAKQLVAGAAGVVVMTDFSRRSGRNHFDEAVRTIARDHKDESWVARISFVIFKPTARAGSVGGEQDCLRSLRRSK